MVDWYFSVISWRKSKTLIGMQIVPVNDPRTENDFFKVEKVIYKNDPHFVAPLRQDIEKIFDPKKNKLFRDGAAQRWILKDAQGNLIGRIAAFVNAKTANTFKQPTGGVGFFECINDQAAANLLFDTGREWLKERGMEAMDGPINFGEKLQFWGLMIKNFTQHGSYGMTYNPEYYISLFENYGFKLYYNQLMFHRDLLMPAQEVFVRKAEMLKQDPEIRVTNVVGWSDKYFAECFLEVYNSAWGGHEGFKMMNFDVAMKTIKAMKPVYDPRIVIFVFKKERPIGFYVNLPELNQVFKYLDGNLNLWGKLKFVWHRKVHPPTTMFGVIFGVVKEYHGRGVEGAMIKFAEEEIAHKTPYMDTILGWIGDFNPKMLKVCESLGASNYRTFATYRYLFDRNAPFERAPIIGSGKHEETEGSKEAES